MDNYGYKRDSGGLFSGTSPQLAWTDTENSKEASRFVVELQGIEQDTLEYKYRTIGLDSMHVNIQYLQLMTGESHPYALCKGEEHRVSSHRCLFYRVHCSLRNLCN
jgi:hypothetical protein